MRSKETTENTKFTPPDHSGSITPENIVCWTCGKKGHRSTVCPVKRVHFAAEDDDETIYLSAVQDACLLKSPSQWSPTDASEDTSRMFLSKITGRQDTLLLLDTQASIHILHSPAITTDIRVTDSPVTVQGITGDRVRITKEGTIRDLSIKGYYSPLMTANIISYQKLRETHAISYDEVSNVFTAVQCNGPTLTFHCINGHYVMDLDTIQQAFVVSVSSKAAEYTKKQLTGARDAYDFMQRMGYISYKAAAEIIQRGSMKGISFTRSDLVNAQQIYGIPAAYQLGQGTQRNSKCREDDPIPLHQSVNQELQVDLFYFLGQAFFLSISVLLGLIMVTPLGPGQDSTSSKDKHSEKSRAKAGKALLLHLAQYHAKGFRVQSVTSDGEGAVKSSRQEVEELGIELNILGRGSHTPHAESAIRHIKNKARSTLHSLPFTLPSKLAAALITFVVHTSNMVPKLNSPGHIPAYTAFKGRIPDYKVDAPFPFGVAGFLQRAQSTQSNTGLPRADYCIWLGTTRNMKGTHKCLNLETLATITGDVFRPAPLTQAAINRLQQLAGALNHDNLGAPSPEPALADPNAPYGLDPSRGVDVELSDMDAPPQGASTTPDEHNIPYEEKAQQADEKSDDQDLGGTILIPANEAPEETLIDISPDDMASGETEQQLQANNPEDVQNTIIDEEDQTNHSDEQIKAARNEMNQGYNFRKSTVARHVYATLTIKEATTQFGNDVTDKAVLEELRNLIKKEVFEFLDPTKNAKSVIPSKMFLTPKKLPNGNIDRMKARLVAGGHRQDRSMYREVETSSPTVALSSVLIAASIAAHRGEHIMTLDHKAAYLNAAMIGHAVHVRLSKEVSALLCKLAPDHLQYMRHDGTIVVKLQKALYGCIESAVLWYKELSSTLRNLGFTKNPYDECSFVRETNGRIDSILVYVDDLMISSKIQSVLTSIAEALRKKYTDITVKLGNEHDFLGIHWNFSTAGQVTLSMSGYVENILNKYNVHTKAKTPATDMLFITNPECPKLNKLKQELFHSCVMELHYLAKRVRSDILTAVSYCATRVLSPDEDDEKKLDRILSYIYGTQDNVLLLRIGETIQINAYVDASFGTYNDMKSITGVIIQIGKATVYVKSVKQKIVTRSSTEAELVGLSDALSQILWTREMLLHQGVPVGPAVIYQDNQSTICLANKGRSTSERTRHVKIRYFFISHYVDTNEVAIVYLPTGEMVADILTKPLHGALFERLRSKLVGLNCDVQRTLE